MNSRTRKRLLILFCLVFVAGGGLVGVHYLRQARMVELIENARIEGYEAYEAGRYADAIEPLTYYVSNEHNDLDAMLALAESRRRCPVRNRAHLHAAKDLALLVRTVEPNNMVALELLLGLYRELGYETERLDVANEICELDTQHEDAHEAKVMALAALRRLPDALDAASKYVELKADDAEAHRLYLQLMHVAAERPERIRDHAIAVSDRYPDEPDFAILRAQGHMAMGEDEQAREILQQAASLSIEQWAVMQRLIAALDAFGMYDEATETLQKGLASIAFHEQALALAVSRQWHRGAINEAFAVLESSDLDPAQTSDHVLGWAAMLTQAEGSATDANRWEAELQGRESEVAATWRWILDAQRARMTDDLAACRNTLLESRDVARRLAENDDDAVMASTLTLIHCMLGEVALDLLEPERALRDLDLAESLDPSSARVHLLHARADLEVGHFDDAVNHAERAFLIKPAVGQAINLLQVYLNVLERGGGGDFLRARTLALSESLLENHPDHYDLALLCVWAQAVAGDPQVAAAELATWDAQRWNAVSADVLVDFASVAGRYGLVVSAPEGSALARRQDIVRMVSESIELSRRGLVGDAASLLEQASASESETHMKQHLDLIRLRILDQAGAADASRVAREIADAWPDSLETQRAVLQSNVAWTDFELVSHCLGRIETLAGANSVTWRLFDARRLMTPGLAADTSGNGDELTPTMLAEASKHILEILREMPHHIDALVLRADIERIEGNLDRAIESLELAIDRNVDGKTQLFPLLINLLHESGYINEAEQRLDEYASLDLQSPNLRRGRAETLTEYQRWSEAILDYLALREIAEETMMAEDYTNAAWLFVKSGEIQEATEWYERALAAPGSNVRTVGAVAVHYASIGRHDEASELIRSLPADQPESMLTQAAYEEALGNLAAAESIYTAHADSEATLDARSALAKFYMRHGRYQEADVALDAALVLDPNDKVLLALQAQVDVASGRALPEEDLQLAMERMIEGSPSQAMRRLGMATRAFDAVSAVNERDSEAVAEGRRKLIATLRDIVDDAPTEYLPWQFLVYELYHTGQTEEAVAAAYRASRAMPGSVRAARLTAETVILAGDWERGLVAVQAWRDLSFPDTLVPDMVTATVSLQRGDAETAFASSRPWARRIAREVSRRPHWGVTLVVASEFAQNGTPDIDEISVVRELLETTSVNAMMLATSRYRAALMNATDDDVVWHRIIDGLEPLADANRLQTIPMLCLADAMARVDDLDGAERVFRLAVQRDSNNPRALSSLAAFLVQHARGSEEAVVLATQAVENEAGAQMSDQTRAAMHDTLGRAYLAIGQLDDAESAFETGRRLDVTSIDIRIGLIEVWIERAAFDQASREMEIIASMDDENWLPDRLTRIESIRQRLDSQQGS